MSFSGKKNNEKDKNKSLATLNKTADFRFLGISISSLIFLVVSG
jgi:hypothetical protein